MLFFNKYDFTTQNGSSLEIAFFQHFTEIDRYSLKFLTDGNNWALIDWLGDSMSNCKIEKFNGNSGSYLIFNSSINTLCPTYYVDGFSRNIYRFNIQNESQSDVVLLLSKIREIEDRLYKHNTNDIDALNDIVLNTLKKKWFQQRDLPTSPTTPTTMNSLFSNFVLHETF